MVFDAAPGELFVIRNIANLVPPYGPDDQPHGVSSAIEYAVRVLRVRDIVVMGHAMCGGIKALLDGTPPELSDFVGPWVRIAEPARQRAMLAPPEHRHDFCEHESVRLSLANLMTFPWIKSAVEAGSLQLHGCFFDIRSGIFEHLDADGVFRADSRVDRHGRCGLVPAIHAYRSQARLRDSRGCPRQARA